MSVILVSAYFYLHRITTGEGGGRKRWAGGMDAEGRAIGGKGRRVCVGEGGGVGGRGRVRRTEPASPTGFKSPGCEDG